MGNSPTTIRGAVPGVDKEPHYNITEESKLCNDFLAHTNSLLLGVPDITGTAESGTVNTLTDNSPDSTPFPSVDQLVGGNIEITAGTGVGQIRTITANTLDTVTVSPDWATTPDATSDYDIGCVEDDSLGAPRTTSTIFTIPSGGLQFSSHNTYESNSVAITPGCNTDTDQDNLEDDRVYSTASGKSPTSSDGIDNDSDTLIDGADPDNECLIPGDLVGGMRSDSTLSLFNGTCTSMIATDYAFYNVALPNNPDDPRSSTNIVTPNAEGTADRIRPLSTDVDPPLGQADGDSPGILNYPDWFLDLYDPDWRPLFTDEGGPQVGPGADPTAPHNGPLKPVIPLAMYGAITDVAGTATPLYFAQFADGDLGTAFTDPNHFFNVGQPGMGQVIMAVLTDVTVARVESSTISDFCSPLISRNLFLGTTLGPDETAGTGDDMIRAANPSVAGTSISKAWTTSQRDTDNDSYENQVDTCPLTSNLDDIRDLATGDPDGDRIDSACDVNPGVGDGLNVDGDVDASGYGLANAYDNCPQVANNTQEQGEGRTTVAAADGGPKTDGIGDACEGPVDRDGDGTAGNDPFEHNGTVTVSQDGYPVTITLSPTVSNGHYHLTTVVEAYCYGGTDADEDGYCAEDLDIGFDNPAVSGNDVRHKAWAGSLIDVNAADRDGDGYSDYVESYMRTNPTKACSFSPAPADMDENSSMASGGIGATSPYAHDTWACDFNDDAACKMQDVIYAFVTSLAPTGFQPAYPPLNRVDFNADGYVNMQDVIFGFVTKLAPIGLNKTCTPETQQ